MPRLSNAGATSVKDLQEELQQALDAVAMLTGQRKALRDALSDFVAADTLDQLEEARTTAHYVLQRIQNEDDEQVGGATSTAPRMPPRPTCWSPSGTRFAAKIELDQFVCDVCGDESNSGTEGDPCGRDLREELEEMLGIINAEHAIDGLSTTCQGTIHRKARS